MSIPGVGPSIAGQVAQEATVSLCGRFVNLFQNRLAAGAVLTVVSAVGIVAGLFGSMKVVDVAEPLIKRIFPGVLVRGRSELSPGAKLSRNVLFFASWGAMFITLNVIVAKCLKLPFSRPAFVGISLVGGALGFGLVIAVEG